MNSELCNGLDDRGVFVPKQFSPTNSLGTDCLTPHGTPEPAFSPEHFTYTNGAPLDSGVPMMGYQPIWHPYVIQPGMYQLPYLPHMTNVPNMAYSTVHGGPLVPLPMYNQTAFAAQPGRACMYSPVVGGGGGYEGGIGGESLPPEDEDPLNRSMAKLERDLEGLTFCEQEKGNWRSKSISNFGNLGSLPRRTFNNGQENSRRIFHNQDNSQIRNGQDYSRNRPPRRGIRDSDCHMVPNAIPKQWWYYLRPSHEHHSAIYRQEMQQQSGYIDNHRGFYQENVHSAMYRGHGGNGGGGGRGKDYGNSHNNRQRQGGVNREYRKNTLIGEPRNTSPKVDSIEGVGETKDIDSRGDSDEGIGNENASEHGTVPNVD